MNALLCSWLYLQVLNDADTPAEAKAGGYAEIHHDGRGGHPMSAVVMPVIRLVVLIMEDGLVGSGHG